MQEFTRGFARCEEGKLAVTTVATTAKPLLAVGSAVMAVEATDEASATLTATSAPCTVNTIQAECAMESAVPASALRVTGFLDQLWTAAPALRVARAATRGLRHCAPCEASVDAFCKGVLTFLCPDGPPQTPEDVNAVGFDPSLRAVAQQLLEHSVLLWMSDVTEFPFPSRVTAVSN